MRKYETASSKVKLATKTLDLPGGHCWQESVCGLMMYSPPRHALHCCRLLEKVPREVPAVELMS